MIYIGAAPVIAMASRCWFGAQAQGGSVRLFCATIAWWSPPSLRGHRESPQNAANGVLWRITDDDRASAGSA
ncbi:MAG: hypothetical protein WCT05_13810 [Lentisphaeria bacterium]